MQENNRILPEDVVLLQNKFAPLSYLGEENNLPSYKSKDDLFTGGDQGRATSTIIKALGIEEETLEINDDAEEQPLNIHLEGEAEPKLLDSSSVHPLSAKLHKKIRNMKQIHSSPGLVLL
ncbi:hypothetical protein DM860_014419 [Cuscuta australis]|uniref:Uncharacterized protein n=1 Tax=Cuscuta australis TaxID=267555 RepID=A0A328DYC6_9ASTE|nr:hypothetical protein DM860_014419 [Cuscuta australis]